jgi:hypothetical protein
MAAGGERAGRRRPAWVVLAALAGAASVLAAPASAAPPPGATARCRDGTYSFSQHRSGTCSHHGGVAVWLTGSGGSGSSAGGAAPDAGRTVLLHRRTRTSRCVVGSLPDRRCSPGAYAAGLTHAVLCSAGFHTSTIRHVTDSERFEVEREYGLAARHYGRTLEIDHIVPLELGGSNDVANLFPEKAVLASGAPGFRVKDRLENRLHAMVCGRAIGLRAAQRGIAANWRHVYLEVFGTPAGR